jgi:serine/threonine protein kinase
LPSSFLSCLAVLPPSSFLLRQGPGGGLNEQGVQFYAGTVVLALEALHDLDIAYRDLKPENLLIGDDGYLVMAGTVHCCWCCVLAPRPSTNISVHHDLNSLLSHSAAIPIHYYLPPLLSTIPFHHYLPSQFTTIYHLLYPHSTTLSIL